MRCASCNKDFGLSYAIKSTLFPKLKSNYTCDDCQFVMRDMFHSGGAVAVKTLCDGEVIKWRMENKVTTMCIYMNARKTIHMPLTTPFSINKERCHKFLTFL